jgi:hypothetical protein
VCFSSAQILSETFLILRWMERNMIKIYINLHVKYLLFLPDFNEFWNFSTDCCKYYNTKFNVNPSSGREFVPCGRTVGWTDKRTNMMKLRVAFRNSANAPRTWWGFLKIHKATDIIAAQLKTALWVFWITDSCFCTDV